MKELEHVLQRVRIRGADGVERKLKESIYAVMRVLADATDKNAPECGCQMSIPELCKRSRKERSTVMEALAGARALRLLTRHAPGSGVRYATHLNLIDIRLVEASQKSRPFLGPVLVYDEPARPSKNTLKTANLETSKMGETQQKCGSKAVLDVQILDVQNLEGEHVLNTPPAPGSILTLVEGVRVESLTLAPLALSSCPSGAGGCGSGSQILADSTFKELQDFSDFLERSQVSGLTTFCQRRRKKDGKRGGVFWEARPKNYTDLLYQAQRAAQSGFEITMQSNHLILLDDLDKEATTELIRAGFELVVIETSLNNFQALLATGPGWTTDQIRSTQRALAARFGGDGNATAARQLHRLPGSLNRKNGECFVTRLHAVQPGALVDPVHEDPANAVVPATGRAQHRSLAGRDITPSGLDFGRACELVARGADHAAVVFEIASRAAARGRRSDHFKYASRTADSAFARLQS